MKSKEQMSLNFAFLIMMASGVKLALLLFLYCHPRSGTEDKKNKTPTSAFCALVTEDKTGLCPPCINKTQTGVKI